MAALALATSVALLSSAGPAGATQVAATLTSGNGLGTFNAALPCSGGGDGDSWRYAYSGVASGGLSGTWLGIAEVHDAGSDRGFVPPGTGLLNVETALGNAHFAFDGGSCAAPSIDLLALPGGPASKLAQTSAGAPLPLVATGGTGSLRNLSGSGTVGFSLELRPGAQNQATLSASADLSLPDPDLEIGNASARYTNLSNWLNQVASVSVTISNSEPPSSVGDAFEVRVVKATLNGRPAGGVLPQLGTLHAGESKRASFRFGGVAPNRTYQLEVEVDAKDALGGPAPGATRTQPVTTPLLFSL